MRRLILLRHAKSEHPLGTADRERGLNPRGRKDAAKMGHYLAHHDLIPDLTIVSDSIRTRETWDLLTAELPKMPVKFDERIYEASADAILAVAGEIAARVRTLMIVGHNPGLQDLSQALIASGDVELREQLNEQLPTTGLVVIDFPVESWNELHPRSGRLDRFVIPRALITPTD
jgi:phosphohistidine phosphatase